MANANVWTKVAIVIQTALAASKTITAITKANPAVVSCAAHGFTVGQEVKITAAGMIEASNMVARVSNVTVGTFELEGVDSTLFNTFTSGGAQLITFGASASTVQDINSSGGEAKAIDITTVHDDTDKEIPGTKSAISYSFGNLWDPADPALIELKKADMVKGTRCVKIIFSTGAKVMFDCYPSASGAPGGSKGAAVTTPTSFKLTGPITSYAT